MGTVHAREPRFALLFASLTRGWDLQRRHSIGIRGELLLTSDYKGKSITARKVILEHMESIASKFGKRLSVHGIRVGSTYQFDILHEVATVVQEYLCQGDFSALAMSSAGLGVAFSSWAASVTESKQLISYESSAPDATKAKIMRQVFREKACNVPYLTEAVDSQDFDIYMGSSMPKPLNLRLCRMNMPTVWQFKKKKLHLEGAEIDLSFNFSSVSAMRKLSRVIHW